MTLTPGDVREVKFREARRGQSGYDEREVDVFLDRVADTLAGRDALTAEDVRAVQFPARKQRKGGYRAEDVDAFLEKVSRALGRQAPASAADRRAAGEKPGSLATSSVRKPSRGGMAPSAPSRASWAPAPAGEPVSAPPPSRRVPSGSAPQAPRAVSAPRVDAGRAHNVAFLDSPPGEPAYDADEVDAFLGRIEATLAGRDTLTAQDVLTATFHPQRPGGRGYSEAGVTAFLVVAAHSLKRLTKHTAPAMRLDASEVRRQLPPAGPGDVMALRQTPPTGAVPQPDHREVYNAAVRRRQSAASSYDTDQVDAFLGRIEATLAGRDTLTAQDILTATFDPPPPGGRGYTEADFLALVAAVLEQPTGADAAATASAGHHASPEPLTAEAIHDVRLHGPPLGQRGYDADEVDAFLDRIEATLAGRDTLTAQDVHDVRFREVPPEQGGYDQNEVEALLDLIEEQLGDEVIHRWHA